MMYMPLLMGYFALTFASGLAGFCTKLGLGSKGGETFFVLAVSAFLLTTLDTATRLARFTWQELCLPRDGQVTKTGGWHDCKVSPTGKYIIDSFSSLFQPAVMKLKNENTTYKRLTSIIE